VTSQKPKNTRHRALGPAPRSRALIKPATQRAHDVALAAQSEARHKVASGVLWVGLICLLTATLVAKHSVVAYVLIGLYALSIGIAVVVHPRALQKTPVRSATPTADELIAAEAAASARADQRQAELNAGQRHLAELEALNASTEKQLVLDEPEPYAQLGATPFRDNFVPLEQRVLRPDNPKPAPQHVNHVVPLAAADEPNTAPATGATTLPPAPKLLK
jgi:hypothetical protein